jgi:hypothetical protein
MEIDIHPISLGFSQIFITQSEGVIIIDGGPPNKAKPFIKGIEKTSIKPEAIEL